MVSRGETHSNTDGERIDTSQTRPEFKCSICGTVQKMIISLNPSLYFIILMGNERVAQKSALYSYDCSTPQLPTRFPIVVSSISFLFLSIVFSCSPLSWRGKLKNVPLPIQVNYRWSFVHANKNRAESFAISVLQHFARHVQVCNLKRTPRKF